jgi:hypothetical protein
MLHWYLYYKFKDELVLISVQLCIHSCEMDFNLDLAGELVLYKLCTQQKCINWHDILVLIEHIAKYLFGGS